MRRSGILRAVAVGFAVAALVAILVAIPVVVVPEIKKRFKATERVTNAPAPDAGFNPTPPAELAAIAGVPLDVYTAARILRSEGGSKASESERVAILWVARNDAKRRDARDVKAGKKALGFTGQVTTASKGSGFYGAQNRGSAWISTREDPLGADVDTALTVFGGEKPDNTGGALKFLHPAAQAAGVAKGVTGYSKTTQTVVDAWRAEGLAPHTVAGVSADRFLVFSPADRPVGVA